MSTKWSQVVNTKKTIESPPPPIQIEEEPKKKSVKNYELGGASMDFPDLPTLIPTPAFLRRRRRYQEYEKFVPLINAEIEYEEMCEEIRADIAYWDKKYEQKQRYIPSIITTTSEDSNASIIIAENLTNQLEANDESDYEA